jgi:hypothetical protein
MNTPIIRLAVLFVSLPVAVLAAWATGSRWVALAVFAGGVILAIAMGAARGIRS